MNKYPFEGITEGLVVTICSVILSHGSIWEMALVQQ